MDVNYQRMAAPLEIQQMVSVYQMGKITSMSTSKQGKQIYLCEQGLIGKDGNTPAQPLLWDQIAVVWCRTKATYAWWSTRKRMLLSTTYTLQRQDGYTFSLDRSLVTQSIERGTLHVMFPAVLQSYVRGQAVPFGPVSVNLLGIRKGAELLSWPQVESAKIEVFDDEVVEIKKRGNWRSWAKIDTALIPNLHVFLALVGYAHNNPGVPVVTPPVHRSIQATSAMPASEQITPPPQVSSLPPTPIVITVAPQLTKPVIWTRPWLIWLVASLLLTLNALDMILCEKDS